MRKNLFIAAVIVTHDESEALRLSDRIMVMNKGKIEESGEASFVFNNPVSPYTQGLIKSIPGRKWG